LVAIVINSPGASPVQSRFIYLRIRALAAEKKLPVIAFAEDVGRPALQSLRRRRDHCDLSRSSARSAWSAARSALQADRQSSGSSAASHVGEHKRSHPFLPENPRT